MEMQDNKIKYALIIRSSLYSRWYLPKLIENVKKKSMYMCMDKATFKHIHTHEIWKQSRYILTEK